MKAADEALGKRPILASTGNRNLRVLDEKIAVAIYKKQCAHNIYPQIQRKRDGKHTECLETEHKILWGNIIMNHGLHTSVTQRMIFMEAQCGI